MQRSDVSAFTRYLAAYYKRRQFVGGWLDPIMCFIYITGFPAVVASVLFSCSLSLSLSLFISMSYDQEADAWFHGNSSGHLHTTVPHTSICTCCLHH